MYEQTYWQVLEVTLMSKPEFAGISKYSPSV